MFQNVKRTKKLWCKISSYTSPLIFILLFSCVPPEATYAPTREVETHAPNSFVGTETCKSCHEKEYKVWKGSHHDQAMKVADATSVLGNFENIHFENNGVKYHFFKKEGKFIINTQDGDGIYKDFEISHTFGVTPLQQYLVPFPDGSYQCLQVAWDSEKGKWFDLQPDLNVATDEWLHWTEGAMTWNTMCADCHSTNLHKNFDTKTSTYNTTYSEINVACESCHGPASQHAAFYQKEKKGTPPDLYMKKGMSSKEVVDKCARCHSRRGQLTTHFDYEGQFLDHYSPALISDDNYELDGQIKNEDYVWGSFVQSKMYHSGVSCLNCHDPHSQQLIMKGNQLCMQCHEPKYDTPKHHFHEQNTASSQCINCHMTGETYMGNDFRRDHSFRVPRPDQTINYGTPNACNECHKDKSAKWASAIIEDKYGEKRQSHFSDLLLPGYHGDQNKLLQLVANSKFPDIARATAIHYLSRSLTQESFNELITYLSDSSALVRHQVVQLINEVTQGVMTVEMTEMLDDDQRLVRIEAAKYFTGSIEVNSDPEALEVAKKENQVALQMQADFPGGQHALALYYEKLGNTPAAIQAYRKALEIDNYYNQARMNLAFLLYKGGNAKEAASLYEKVIEQEPAYSQSYYMLGLLNNEQGDNSAALKYMKLACTKQPANDRAFYNYALLLQQGNKFTASIAIIDEALLLFPGHEELLYIKVLAQINMKDTKNALLTLNQLILIAPNNGQYTQMKMQLSATK
jgi:predicted CXXCH cytochrome family protein